MAKNVATPAEVHSVLDQIKAKTSLDPAKLTLSQLLALNSVLFELRNLVAWLNKPATRAELSR